MLKDPGVLTGIRNLSQSHKPYVFDVTVDATGLLEILGRFEVPVKRIYMEFGDIGGLQNDLYLQEH